MNNFNHISAIVLAAGKGTRIGQELPKVLYRVAGKPMIYYSLSLLDRVGIKDKNVVIGFKSDEVKASIGRSANYVYQWQQKGTADAVKTALKEITSGVETILVINGDDSAFYKSSTIRRLLRSHEEQGAMLSFLTIRKKEPGSLGRVKRDQDGRVVTIIEAKEASPQELEITEVNAGCYCFNFEWLRINVEQIKAQASNGEFYLTDLISLASNQGKIVNSQEVGEDEWYGINSKEELALANRNMVKRLQARKQPLLFLVNLDNTIIDVDRIKQDLDKEINTFLSSISNNGDKKDYIQKFWQAYDEVKKDRGFVDIPEACRVFASQVQNDYLAESLKNIFFSLSFEDYLLPDAYSFLESLHNMGELVLIAEGDLVYQPIKIRKAGLIPLVDDYFVFENIGEGIKQISAIYKDWDILMIDDQLVNIAEAKKVSPQIKGVWLQYGEYQNEHLDKKDMVICYEQSLAQLLGKITSFLKS
ncbi:NTP transferase domain-containing protein [Candidatus Beckwithbacteria bacterium]|nr:NTP transferase domain-containing protein [Candidatus Beckwithbacteria bacterium]